MFSTIVFTFYWGCFDPLLSELLCSLLPFTSASHFHSCTVFSLSPLFSCCTVAGWHGRMSGIKEITIKRLHARKFLCLRTKRVLVIYFTPAIIFLTCSATVIKTGCCFMKPFLYLLCSRGLTEGNEGSFSSVQLLPKNCWFDLQTALDISPSFCAPANIESPGATKLCTVPFALFAIHVHHPCQPYSFNLLST